MLSFRTYHSTRHQYFMRVSGKDVSGEAYVPKLQGKSSLKFFGFQIYLYLTLLVKAERRLCSLFLFSYFGVVTLTCNKKREYFLHVTWRSRVGCKWSNLAFTCVLGFLESAKLSFVVMLMGNLPNYSFTTLSHTTPVVSSLYLYMCLSDWQLGFSVLSCAEKNMIPC